MRNRNADSGLSCGIHTNKHIEIIFPCPYKNIDDNNIKDKLIS